MTGQAASHAFAPRQHNPPAAPGGTAAPSQRGGFQPCPTSAACLRLIERLVAGGTDWLRWAGPRAAGDGPASAGMPQRAGWTLPAVPKAVPLCPCIPNSHASLPQGARPMRAATGTSNAKVQVLPAMPTAKREHDGLWLDKGRLLHGRELHLRAQQAQSVRHRHTSEAEGRGRDKCGSGVSGDGGRGRGARASRSTCSGKRSASSRQARWQGCSRRTPQLHVNSQR